MDDLVKTIQEISLLDDFVNLRSSNGGIDFLLAFESEEGSLELLVDQLNPNIRK